jgi:hypothetical protein
MTGAPAGIPALPRSFLAVFMFKRISFQNGMTIQDVVAGSAYSQPLARSKQQKARR